MLPLVAAHQYGNEINFCIPVCFCWISLYGFKGWEIMLLFGWGLKLEQ